MPHNGRPRHLAAIAILGLLGAGCTPAATGPCASPASSITFDVTVTENAMDPSALDVCRDQVVTLEVASETAGALHLHGYDVEVDLEPGATETIEFTADIAGQFILELHDPSGEGETEVGVLTVYEP
jgi:hypothetical protein